MMTRAVFVAGAGLLLCAVGAIFEPAAQAGPPSLAGRLTGEGEQSPGVLFVDLLLTNTGGPASNIVLNQLGFRTLAGAGIVTYNAGVAPAPLPLAIGNLNSNTSTTVRLFLNVPATVAKFSIVEDGMLEDQMGTSYAFSMAQVVYPVEIPGTVLFDATDPAFDDNGPGNYAYPTAADFHAGAFDILEFKVTLSPDGSSVTFQLRVRDLTPTFGSPLGAQLVDVYVHNPNAAAADTSTAASFPQRNYEIAAGSAWSRLLEVQGFGQRYIDAHGTTVGTISISANAISRIITFSVPTASLGGVPGSGWGFTVVLTGQDGFSPDQARNFTSTPGPFTFGVCAAVSTDPHCTVDPSTVPKAMDTLTPPGVLQSDELDYTIHSPVVLQAVVIP